MTATEAPIQPAIRGVQHCPVCGLEPDRIHQQAVDNGVRSVTLLCAQAHLWNVRWPVIT